MCLSIRLILSSYIKTMQMILLYHHWVIMMSMTMRMIRSIPVTQILNILALPSILPPQELQMAPEWKALFLRMFRSFSHHLLDGNGVLGMVSNLLRSRKLSCDMHRLVIPFIGYALLLDSNQPCSALRFALLTHSRQRPEHGMPSIVLTPLSMSMHAFTAWPATHFGRSDRQSQMDRISHSST